MACSPWGTRQPAAGAHCWGPPETEEGRLLGPAHSCYPLTYPPGRLVPVLPPASTGLPSEKSCWLAAGGRGQATPGTCSHPVSEEALISTCYSAHTNCMSICAGDSEGAGSLPMLVPAPPAPARSSPSASAPTTASTQETRK